MRRNRVLSLVFLPLFACSLYGCGSQTAQAPTLLTQAKVNGSYAILSNTTTSVLLFNSTFVSTGPVANSGANYYAPVTASLTPAVTNDLGTCNGTVFNLSGKVTNPSGSDVDISMSGSAPGGGTMTLGGSVSSGSGNAGQVIVGSIQISGGSCSLAQTPIIAYLQ